MNFTKDCNNLNFDAVVIGGGHAGCEAGLALARLNSSVLLCVLDEKSIGYMPCNPSIGGTSKGQLVCEIDALGGEMGVLADKVLLQIKMLNLGKGAAVQSLRGQADKELYHFEMKKVLQNTPNLSIKQCEIIDILIENGKVCGVLTNDNQLINCKTVVAACGAYLNSSCIRGENRLDTGPSNFANCKKFTQSLIKLGLEIRRFKTGTPARVKKDSIDFSKAEPQYGDGQIGSFSALTEDKIFPNHPCYLTYTTKETKEIILANLDKAPMYSGKIKGTGARYCPSIEDKVTRFAEKERHQVFIEPEGFNSDQMYIQGLSTSFSEEMQEKIYRTVPGLENLQIVKYAYAIEYDCIDSTALTLSLEHKNTKGLFFAGQICGSSGYEEAAAQGLIAGINASHYLHSKEPFILLRSDAYIGVLIDDLVTKGTNEPYRMMTSRAEYRLKLRTDNAAERLTEIGKKVGLCSESRWKKFEERQVQISALRSKLDKFYSEKICNPFLALHGEEEAKSGISLEEMLRRPKISIDKLIEFLNLGDFSKPVQMHVETEVKYAGYLKKEETEIVKMKKMHSKILPPDLDYTKISGLRLEARQKLQRMRPQNLFQASNISGVSPADISVLILYLKMKMSSDF